MSNSTGENRINAGVSGGSTYSLYYNRYYLDSLSLCTVVRESSLIPSLINDYKRLKDTFVRICNKIREPSLQEMKNYCVDIIAFAEMKDERRLSRVEDDLHRCHTIEELANILFRRLCTWITFDFLESVLEYFRIQLREVRIAVDGYKEKMRPILEEKLEALTNLQSEYPDECRSREGFLRIIARHHLDPHGISISELLAARNFLCHKLKIRRELLQVLTTFLGSVSIVLLTIRQLEPAILTAVENSKDDLFRFGILSIKVGSHTPILITPPVIEVVSTYVCYFPIDIFSPHLIAPLYQYVGCHHNDHRCVVYVHMYADRIQNKSLSLGSTLRLLEVYVIVLSCSLCDFSLVEFYLSLKMRHSTNLL